MYMFDLINFSLFMKALLRVSFYCCSGVPVNSGPHGAVVCKLWRISVTTCQLGRTAVALTRNCKATVNKSTSTLHSDSLCQTLVVHCINIQNIVCSKMQCHKHHKLATTKLTKQLRNNSSILRTDTMHAGIFVLLVTHFTICLFTHQLRHNIVNVMVLFDIKMQIRWCITHIGACAWHVTRFTVFCQLVSSVPMVFKVMVLLDALTSD